MNTRSASIGASTRSTPSDPCSASLATQLHRHMPRYTRVSGSTLDVVGVGLNRIGMVHTFEIFRQEVLAAPVLDGRQGGHARSFCRRHPRRNERFPWMS